MASPIYASTSTSSSKQFSNSPAQHKQKAIEPDLSFGVVAFCWCAAFFIQKSNKKEKNHNNKFK
jgi:hypothetical protein